MRIADEHIALAVDTAAVFFANEDDTELRRILEHNRMQETLAVIMGGGFTRGLKVEVKDSSDQNQQNRW